MSGICSAHQGHDFDCLQCAALPVDKAELLYTAWCMEFAPDPSWWYEDVVIRARWRNVAEILWPSGADPKVSDG